VSLNCPEKEETSKKKKNYVKKGQEIKWWLMIL
jgi:hypothetical protein